LKRKGKSAIANGQIIEDYPNDKYAPSCLICGITQTGKTIHIQSSYPIRPLVKIITVLFLAIPTAK